jgi:hypothetical protein
MNVLLAKFARPIHIAKIRQVHLIANASKDSL